MPFGNNILKPRIFLFSSEKGFLGQLVPDLQDLIGQALNVKTGKIYAHVGFSAPEKDKIVELLQDKPNGLFCSRAFRDGDPGDAWSFSDNLCSDDINLGLFFVYDLGRHDYSVSEETKEQINLCEQKVASIKKNNSTISFKSPTFETKADAPLSELGFSNKTMKLFDALSIENLSDLLIFLYHHHYMLWLTKYDFYKYHL